MKRLALIMFAALALPPSASAAPVSIPSPDEDAQAYAADRVVWAVNTYERDQIAIHMRAAGGRDTQLGLVTLKGSSRGTAVELSLAANASGYVAALRDSRADVVVRGGWSGPPVKLL